MEGEGARSAPRSGDPVIGESGDRKTKNLTTDNTDQNPGIRKSTPGMNCVSPLDS
jgi:hypothetical protein